MSRGTLLCLASLLVLLYLVLWPEYSKDPSQNALQTTPKLYSTQNISEPELRHRKTGGDDEKFKRKGVGEYRELVSFCMR